MVCVGVAPTGMRELVSGVQNSALALVVSVFIYVSFHNAYKPSEISNLPINLAFQPCYGHTTSRCSYPTTSVRIDRRAAPLLQGQTYSISLSLTLPDSPSTEEVGMFMSCANVTSAQHQATVVGQACKSAVPQYRTPLLRYLETLTLGLPLMLGLTSQEQQITIPYFAEFKPDPRLPAEEIHIEVLSTILQIKSAFLHVKANLSGLRYLMYRHSIISSFLGISTILLVIYGIFLLSYTRLQSQKEEYENLDDSGSCHVSGEQNWSSDEEEMVDIRRVDSASVVADDVAESEWNLEAFEAIFTAVHLSSQSFITRAKEGLFKFASLLSLKLAILTVKLFLVLCLVTGSYEVLVLGINDPRLLLEETKEDMKFVFLSVKDAFLYVFNK